MPGCLSPVFLASCLHGEETITEADLLLSFKSYITPDEREVLERVLSEDFESDDEDLIEFLSSAIENLSPKISKVCLQSLRTKKSFKSQSTSPTAGPLC